MKPTAKKTDLYDMKMRHLAKNITVSIIRNHELRLRAKKSTVAYNIFNHYKSEIVGDIYGTLKKAKIDFISERQKNSYQEKIVDLADKINNDIMRNPAGNTWIRIHTLLQQANIKFDKVKTEE